MWVTVRRTGWRWRSFTTVGWLVAVDLEVDEGVHAGRGRTGRAAARGRSTATRTGVGPGRRRRRGPCPSARSRPRQRDCPVGRPVSATRVDSDMARSVEAGVRANRESVGRAGASAERERLSCASPGGYAAGPGSRGLEGCGRLGDVVVAWDRQSTAAGQWSAGLVGGTVARTAMMPMATPHLPIGGGGEGARPRRPGVPAHGGRATLVGLRISVTAASRSPPAAAPVQRPRRARQRGRRPTSTCRVEAVAAARSRWSGGTAGRPARAGGRSRWAMAARTSNEPGKHRSPGDALDRARRRSGVHIGRRADLSAQHLLGGEVGGTCRDDAGGRRRSSTSLRRAGCRRRPDAARPRRSRSGCSPASRRRCGDADGRAWARPPAKSAPSSAVRPTVERCPRGGRRPATALDRGRGPVRAISVMPRARSRHVRAGWSRRPRAACSRLSHRAIDASPARSRMTATSSSLTRSEAAVRRPPCSPRAERRLPSR